MNLNQRGREVRLVVLAWLCLFACGRAEEGDSVNSSGTGANLGSGGKSEGSGGAEGDSGGTSNTGSGGRAAGGTPGTAGEHTGGASTGGASSGGADLGGAGSGGGEPGEGIARLGDPCDEPGALACAGSLQKLTLVCAGNETWSIGLVCDGTRVCDTAPGLLQGTCQEQVPACLGHEPGWRYCDGQSVVECGANNLSVSTVEDCIACVNGACDDSAPDACPSEGIVDCYDTCPSSTGSCTRTGDGCPLLVEDEVQVPLVRTPPSTVECAERCDGLRYIFVQLPWTRTVRATIPSGATDWSLHAFNEEQADACRGDELVTCLIVPPSRARGIIVKALSAEAPQRNVRIEFVPDGTVCQ